jgi:hypothetical protein
MVEKLLSFAILLNYELISHERYIEYLNEIFLHYPDNDFLLELQWCSSDTKKTIDIILEYTKNIKINYNEFGKFLLVNLEAAYSEMDLCQFCAKSYQVWSMLPNIVANEQPFWTLSYADEPLSWGDEKQTRKLYEGMFKHYKNNRG